jgi:hypothetical protein
VRIYSVYQNGVLKKVNKIEFKDEKVYLIDDFKTFYLWFGSNSSKKKREFGKKRASELNQNRKSPARIEIIHQNQEFGAFLVIMDIIKGSMKKEISSGKRGELVIEPEDTLELIDAGLEMDLEAEITLAAHQLSQEGLSYEELSRRLAESHLMLFKDMGKPSEKEIAKKTKEILDSSSTYDELCWLVSELEILIKKKQLE